MKKRRPTGIGRRLTTNTVPEKLMTDTAQHNEPLTELIARAQQKIDAAILARGGSTAITQRAINRIAAELDAEEAQARVMERVDAAIDHCGHEGARAVLQRMKGVA